MRIFPIALIVIGTLGVAKYLGLIPIGMGPLIGPLLLIALGVALLLRRPRGCRSAAMWDARRSGRTMPGTPPQPPTGTA